MEFSLKHQANYSLIEITLKPGEKLKTESDALVYMTPNFEVKKEFGGSLLTALSTKVFGGESLFVKVYTAREYEGILGIVSNLRSDVSHVTLHNSAVIIQKGAFLASSVDIKVETMFSGIHSLLGGENAFLLRAFGSGDLFYTSDATLVPVHMRGSYVVDAGHVTVFEKSLSISKKDAHEALADSQYVQLGNAV